MAGLAVLPLPLTGALGLAGDQWRASEAFLGLGHYEGSSGQAMSQGKLSWAVMSRRLWR